MIVPWWKTNLQAGEAHAAMKAIASGKISQGDITAELESKLAEMLGVPYVTMTTSGSVALLMALITCGVRPGDEVIVPNRSFIATAHAPMLLGAKVCLVDTLSGLPLIDPEKVESSITPRTKAIIPVCLNGRAYNISHLKEMAVQNGVYLIEDAAQALFSKNNKNYIGTSGHFGCFSLGVTKLITSGQGGFIVTHDLAFHEHLQLLRTHGVISPLSEKFDKFGFNFRYTDIQAAIALKQLELVDIKIKAHIDLYKRYSAHIQSLRCIRMLEVNIDKGEIPLWIEVLSDHIDLLHNILEIRSIETRKAVPNLNVSPHLKDDREFPNSTFFDKHLLTLPSGPDQERSNISLTLNAITEFDNKQREINA
jgi:dTDP-4-amino-4,6-dideoxygalactose transaminase